MIRAYIFIFSLILCSACNEASKEWQLLFDKTDKGIGSGNENRYMGKPSDEPITLNRTEYIEWIIDKNNGLNVEKRINEFIFKSQFKPDEFEALLSLNSDNQTTNSALLEKVEEIKDAQYFTLSISCHEANGDILKYKVSDANEYYARVEYYSFNVQNDITLIDGKDTLQCALCHFERTYSSAPVIKLILAFPESKQPLEKESCHQKTLCFDDRVFSCGKVNIEITQEAVCSIPRLKFD